MNVTTVFRMEKIQSLQELSNKCFHCYDYTHKEINNFNNNIKDIFNKPFWTLIGKPEDAYRDIKKIKNAFKVEERKNSCKAIEAVFSLSPEFFGNGTPDKERVKEFTNRTLRFMRNEFGEDRIAHAVLHLHETTPHIHAFIVPWEEVTKRGRYDCEPYNGIRTKKYSPDYMSQLQTKFNNEFRDLGLKPVNKKLRKGKDRKEIKEFYLEQIEENKINNISLQNLEVENEQLRAELIETKKELSKLRKVIEYVKVFFNVEKLKDLMERIKPEPKYKEENNSVSFDYSEVEEKITSSLKPKPEDYQPKKKTKKGYKHKI